MIWALLLSFFVGAATVLQGGMNRQIAVTWGVSGAVLLNTVLYAILSLALFWTARKFPSLLPEVLWDRGSFTNFSWWYLLPGLCGFFIVVGAPIVIARIGAFQFILGVVAVQLAGGILWDVMIEKIPVTSVRMAGAVLAFVSVVMVGWKK